MKQLVLFISALFLSAGTSFGQCPGSEIAPWIETFPTNALPGCWTTAGPTPWEYGSSATTPTGPAGWGAAGTPDHSTPANGTFIMMDGSDNTNGEVSSLTTNFIDVSGLTVPELRYWIFSNNTNNAQNNLLEVEVWDGAAWNLVNTNQGNLGATWFEFLFDLSTLTITGDIQIRFTVTGDDTGGSTFYNDILIDDVEVREQPTCPQPSGIIVSNVMGTSADVTWTDNAGASEWELEYGPTGYTPGTGTSVIVNSTSETVTGLMNSTDYTICVRAVCGVGDTSTWLCSSSFQTPCGTFPAPFLESFETAVLPNCWTEGGVNAWEYGSTATGGFAQYGAAGVTDYSASGTGQFIGMDGSNNNAGEVSTLLTPFIDASTLTLPMVSYAVFYNNIDNQVFNELMVEFWDGSTWTTINTVNANLGTNWVEFTTIIDPLTITGDVQMRFTVTAATTGSTFYNDILLDDIELKEAPPCPNPSNLVWTGGDATTAGLSWTNGWQETQWILEYGPQGFTPGSGTQVPAFQNPDTLTGLTPDQFYDVYVYADCGGGDTSNAIGPVIINTFNQGQYMESDVQCPPAGFIDISATGVNMNINYNGEAPIDPLPFNMLFQNTPITNMTVGNNGGVVLGNPTANIGAGGNFTTLPDGSLFAWGDLLDDETGDVYWQQIGTSPNSVLVVQWNNINNAFGNIASPTVTFQMQFDEATQEIFYVYDDVVFGGGNAGDDFGANADIGLSGPNQDITLSVNDPTFLQENTCARFYYTNCPRPENYAVSYTTSSEGAITWNAGLSNETEWQVIYGVQGFDPQTGGTSVTINSGSALIIPGLDDMTTYDVYIMALCANGDTSFALTGDFTTLPNCADPTGLAGATAVDSIFTAWNYTANSGFPIQEFAFEYGPTGYMNGMGTQVYGIDTINTTDTLVDATLMSGGLYDVYIQAVCNTGDSSNWVGPITVTMPLTNDSTCLAQAIPVDGMNYSFNGTGATVAAGEASIAPPAGPCDGQMTWCNSSVTASTWYTFVAPASGNVRIDGEFQNFDGQVAVYETSDCNDFNQYNLIGANDDFNTTGDDFIYLNLCGLTPGNTYYMMHDPNGAAGVYSVRIQEIAVEAGTDNGQLDVCLGDIVDLNTQLTGADAGGTWMEDIPTAGFNDPIWSSAGLASQVYTFQYMVVDGCAVDSVGTTVRVWAPSFAGNDGTIDACRNEPVDLLQGLVGSIGVSFTGTWYDPSANALPSSDITANSIPGQYNYQYIAGNGICPDDSSTVTVIVDPNCDYLNLQDLTFNGMDIYPNPTTNVFYISNEGATEVFNYELTDLNGKVITAKEAAITGVETTEVNVEKLETGVYLIRIFNENAEKTFRVVKQ
ncbi:MAG: fibronectin type III domain-containing protein [Fluviicola sp.]